MADTLSTTTLYDNDIRVLLNSREGRMLLGLPDNVAVKVTGISVYKAGDQREQDYVTVNWHIVRRDEQIPPGK